MVRKEVHFLAGNLKLEGILSYTEGIERADVVILCHPHPLYGGNMNSSVIVRIAHTLSNNGKVTLRFNFRGVGKSQGTYDEGRGEVEDVVAAVDYLGGLKEIIIEKIYIVGYSFGAMVGTKASVKDSRVHGWVAIALPIAFYDFDYLEVSKQEKLLISGEYDPISPKEKLEVLYEKLKEPKALSFIPGTDHFFFSKEHLLAQEVLSFLGSYPQKKKRGRKKGDSPLFFVGACKP